jgi:hypothetical protein
MYLLHPCISSITCPSINASGITVHTCTHISFLKERVEWSKHSSTTQPSPHPHAKHTPLTAMCDTYTWTVSQLHVQQPSTRDLAPGPCCAFDLLHACTSKPSSANKGGPASKRLISFGRYTLLPLEAATGAADVFSTSTK